MLDVLLFVAALLALCIFYSSLRGISSAAAPLLALCTAILWVTAFGMAGALRLGGWLFYAGSAALGALALWRTKPKKLLARLATPGFVLFFTGALVLGAWLAYQQPLFSSWDEFTFWGIAPKITKTQHILYPMARPGFWWTMTEYPALVVLAYVAQFFGTFAPWKVYWAYGLLYLACAAVLLAPFGRRQWRIAIPLAVCGLLLPFFATVPYETVELAKTWLSAYADLPGGMLFGGTLCLYYTVRQSRRGALWQVLPPLAVLAIVKENITPVALVAAGVFAADVLFFGARPLGSQMLGGPAKPRHRAGRLLWPLGFFAAVITPFLAWKAYAQWANVLNPNRGGNQTNDVSPGGGLVQAVREILGLAPKSEPFQPSLDRLWDSFLGRVPAGDGSYIPGILRVGMAGTALATTLLIVAVFALGILLAAGAHRKGRMALAGGLLLGGWAAYHFMLFVSYAFLSHTKSEGIFDYVRYTTSYTTGWLMLGLLLLGLCAQWAPASRGWLARAAVLALAVALAARCAFMLRPGYAVWDMPANAYETERTQQADAGRLAAAMPPNAHIFYVHQGEGGGEAYLRRHYYLYPQVVEYSITGGGPLVLPPPGETLEELHSYAPPQRIRDYLEDFNCQYILIDSLDADFVQNYGFLFDDLDPAATPALYEKQPSGLYARVPL